MSVSLTFVEGASPLVCQHGLDRTAYAAVLLGGAACFSLNLQSSFDHVNRMDKSDGDDGGSAGETDVLQ